MRTEDDPAWTGHDAPEPWWRRLGATLLSWGTTALFAVALLAVVGRLRAPDLPDTAPPLRLPDTAGQALDLASLRGQTVVVNFWATWCGPCRAELPMLAAWARNHPDIVVLGVAADRDPAVVQRLLPSLELPYRNLLDPDGRAQRAWGVTTLPTTVVVGPDGAVRGAHTGIVGGPLLDALVAGW